eukprot:6773278-Prymnesium_polylepis.1
MSECRAYHEHRAVARGQTSILSARITEPAPLVQMLLGQGKRARHPFDNRAELIGDERRKFLQIHASLNERQGTQQLQGWHPVCMRSLLEFTQRYVAATHPALLLTLLAFSFEPLLLLLESQRSPFIRLLSTSQHEDGVLLLCPAQPLLGEVDADERRSCRPLAASA